MRNLGTMWRELPSHEKDKYTARAQGTEIPATPGAGVHMKHTTWRSMCKPLHVVLALAGGGGWGGGGRERERDFIRSQCP
jgi:hypothetical protein